MTIDSHRHFWKYSDSAFAWIDDARLRRDFLPGDAAAFDPCVAVEARQCVEETDWLLELAARHDFIRGVVGWLPIASPGFEETLDRYAGRPGLAGLRHVVQDEPDDGFILRDDFRRGVRRLLSRALAYDILVFERHLPNTIKFVDSMPDDARLVLDHLGKPRDFASWRRLVQDLSRRENVRCKLSGLVTEVGRTDPASLRPYLEVALDAFGPDRLMFGSDWPVVTAHMPYAAWRGVVEDFASRLSPGERDAVMWRTAVRFYNLQEKEG